MNSSYCTRMLRGLARSVSSNTIGLIVVAVLSGMTSAGAGEVGWAPFYLTGPAPKSGGRGGVAGLFSGPLYPYPSLPNYYPILGGLPAKNHGVVLPPVAPRVLIDESMDGQVVPANPGDLIEVRLKASGGIPYAWVLDARNGTSVVPNGAPRDEVGPGLEAGRPVNRVVPFQAVAAGGTTLRFELKSFVPSNPPAKTFTVTIRVIPNRKPGKK